MLLEDAFDSSTDDRVTELVAEDEFMVGPVRRAAKSILEHAFPLGLERCNRYWDERDRSFAALGLRWRETPPLTRDDCQLLPDVDLLRVEVRTALLGTLGIEPAQA